MKRETSESFTPNGYPSNSRFDRHRLTPIIGLGKRADCSQVCLCPQDHIPPTLRPGEIRSRAKAEARILSRPRGVSGVPGCFGIVNGETLVLEYLRGTPLPELSWSVDKVVSMLLDLLRILHELEKRKVFHGDIKPLNILALKDVAGFGPVDFGFALDASKVTYPVPSDGSLGYIARENLK